MPYANPDDRRAASRRAQRLCRERLKVLRRYSIVADDSAVAAKPADLKAHSKAVKASNGRGRPRAHP